jgi:hypothetical protein
MAKKRNDVAKQAMDLWKKTVAQLEEISKVLGVESVIDRIKADHARLLAERDKLFKRLGEETYKLIDKNKIKVPQPVKETYQKIRDLMERLLGTKKAKKKTAKKKTARKSTKKASTRRKVTKKKAKA